MIVIALCSAGAFWFGVTRLIVSSSVVKEAIGIAEKDPAVTALLGTPLKPGWMVRGNIQINNDSGHADATIPLVGPRGKGDLRIVAQRENGVWRYQTLSLHSGGRTIDLLPRPAGSIDL